MPEYPLIISVGEIVASDSLHFCVKVTSRFGEKKPSK